MGLLLGGSALTVFELCDFIVFHYLNKLLAKKPPPPQDEEEQNGEPSGGKPGERKVSGVKGSPLRGPQGVKEPPTSSASGTTIISG